MFCAYAKMQPGETALRLTPSAHGRLNIGVDVVKMQISHC